MAASRFISVGAGIQRFKGKVAIVTGGGAGIGEAIADRLLTEGARVAVGQRRASTTGKFIETDLADCQQCAELVNQTVAAFGGVDILINNAGIMQQSGVEEMPLEDWNRAIAVNLTAPFLLTKYALPHLRVNGGTIINIGSIEGLGANPGHAAYCASKGGLHALTRAIAVDHGKHRIRCNTVAPGWIDTDLNTAFIESMSNPAQFKQQIGNIHPIGRTGTAEEVANLVCWLASDEASFITGQVYSIDGGRMAKISLPN